MAFFLSFAICTYIISMTYPGSAHACPGKLLGDVNAGHVFDTVGHTGHNRQHLIGQLGGAYVTTAVRYHLDFLRLRQGSGDFGGHLKLEYVKMSIDFEFGIWLLDGLYKHKQARPGVAVLLVCKCHLAVKLEFFRSDYLFLNYWKLISGEMEHNHSKKKISKLIKIFAICT